MNFCVIVLLVFVKRAAALCRVVEGPSGPAPQVFELAVNVSECQHGGVGIRSPPWNATYLAVCSPPPVYMDWNGSCPILWVGSEPVPICNGTDGNSTLVFASSFLSAASISVTGTPNQVLVQADPTNTSFRLSAPQDIGAASTPEFAGLTISQLQSFGLLHLTAQKRLASTPLANGQLLIGSTDSTPEAATLTGTPRQIGIETGAHMIRVFASQDLDQLSTPTFQGVALTGLTVNGAVFHGSQQLQSSAALGDGQLLIGGTGVAPAAANLQGTPGEIIVTNGPRSIVLSTSQNISSGASPTFAGMVLSSLSANATLTTDSTSRLTSLVLDSGQVVIGATGASPRAAALTGTANQVIVTPGANSITLSAPQNLDVGATPTFAGLSIATTTFSAPAPAAPRTYTIYDAGSACNVQLGIAKTTTLTSNTTLSLADSGALFLLGNPSSASRVTLPSAAGNSGAVFKFVLPQALTRHWTITDNAATLVGGAFTAGTWIPVNQETFFFAVANNALAGDWVEFVGIGGLWRVFGASIFTGAFASS